MKMEHLSLYITVLSSHDYLCIEFCYEVERLGNVNILWMHDHFMYIVSVLNGFLYA